MSRPPVAIKPAGAVDRFGSGMPAIGSHDESTLPDRRDGPYIDRIRWESLSGNGFGAGWSLAGTDERHAGTKPKSRYVKPRFVGAEDEEPCCFFKTLRS